MIELSGILDAGVADKLRADHHGLSIFVTINGVHVEHIAEEALCGSNGWALVVDNPPRLNEARDEIIKHKKYGEVKAWMA